MSAIIVDGIGKAYKKYKSKTLKIRLKVFTKIIKAKILYNPFLRKIIMKSGISNISIIDENK